MAISPELKSQIIQYLAVLPDFRSRSGRIDFLSRCAFTDDLISQIDLEGNAHEFTTHLIDRLAGLATPGSSPRGITSILEAARQVVGEFDTESLADIDHLINQIYLPSPTEARLTRHNLPPRRGRLVGRDSEVNKIVGGLTSESTSVLVLTGPKLVGKKSIALESAYHILEINGTGDFDAIVWQNAHYRPLELRELCTALSRMLRPTAPPDLHEAITPQDLFDLLQQTNQHCLLVIPKLLPGDQPAVEFLASLPTPNRALVTTFAVPTSLGRAIYIQPMNQEASLELIREQAREKGQQILIDAPDNDLRLLADKCGGFPPVLCWAVGRISEDSSLDEVIDDLNKARADPFKIWEDAYIALEAQDKQVLQGIVAFPRDTSRDALVWVTGLELDNVRRSLSRLVSSGMVNTNQALHEKDKRYSLYNQVRNYLQNRMTASRRDWIVLYNKAEDYLVQFCQQNGREQWDRYPLINAEMDNLQALFQILELQKEYVPLLELVDNLQYYLTVIGSWRLRLAWGQAALKAADALEKRRAKAEYQIELIGWSQVHLGDMTAAETAIHQGLSFAVSNNDPIGQACAWRNLGSIERKLGRYENAARLYDTAEKFAMQVSDDYLRQRLLGQVSASRGTLANRMGDLALARQMYGQALGKFRKIGHEAKMAMIYSRLGDVARQEGVLDRAEWNYKESQRLAQAVQRTSTMAYNELGLAFISEAQQHYKEALVHVENAYRLFHGIAIVNELGEIEQALELYERLKKITQST